VQQPGNDHDDRPLWHLPPDDRLVRQCLAGQDRDRRVEAQGFLDDGAGEFEIGGVFITGVQTDGGGSGKKKAKDREGSPRNTVYVFDYDGITVAHLGDLKDTPTQSEIESLGTINVALVPVGGGGGLNAAKAAEIISLIEPNLVIPMHYATPAAKVSLDALNKFIKEMGLSMPGTQQSLKVTRSGLPDETHVVVLDYQKS